MKTFYLEIEYLQARTNKPFVKEMLWYDLKEKQMKKFVGSQLKFKFDLDKMSMVTSVETESLKTNQIKYNFENGKIEKVYQQPKPVLMNEACYETVSNKSKIVKWISDNQSQLGFEINNEETRSNVIAIDVDDSLIKGVEDSIEENGFRYTQR